MIYVNSETILKIDRFSLLRYERVIHIWDILFLTITYVMFFMNSLYNKKIILTIHMNTLNIVCSFGKYAEIPCIIIKFLKI